MSASKQRALIGTSHRFQSLIPNPCRLLLISKRNEKRSFLGTDQRLHFLKIGLSLRELVVSKRKMDVAVHSSVPLVPPIPSNPASPGPQSRKVWIVGLIASAILPFIGIKFGPLLKLKQEVDTVVDTAEDVAEVVEKVAEEVEIVAEEIAEHLPAGGKLKVVATFIENVAETTAKDARLVEDVIDKVRAMEKDAESFIAVIDQAKKTSKE
ncbi:uncharacterized protein LOC111984981 [Quercus suber]|uniref:Plastid-targeted protein 2 n=1 Tax=Quercus suber TaxID=58331 RepID=A0AAW0LME6_QUESU|nr:uncharacterized protein LOC111984981 [Quercus suber]POE85952.1 hypothetical protein CFP56_23536 [Quercus suber]